MSVVTWLSALVSEHNHDQDERKIVVIESYH